MNSPRPLNLRSTIFSANEGIAQLNFYSIPCLNFIIYNYEPIIEI